jgi:hypothetical protein
MGRCRPGWADRRGLHRIAHVIFFRYVARRSEADFGPLRLGIFSDKTITFMAKRNGGVHERKLHECDELSMVLTFACHNPSRDPFDSSRYSGRIGRTFHRPLRCWVRSPGTLPLVCHHLLVLWVVLCFQ